MEEEQVRSAMDRVTWIEHKGKRIILEDMSGLREPNEVCMVSDTSTALICKQPKASVLLITHVTGTRYNPTVINRLKENTKLTTPHMKAYVVVGITGLMRVVLHSVVIFTGQDIKMCDTVEEAKEWLA
jgi:hypothetical protein